MGLCQDKNGMYADHPHCCHMLVVSAIHTGSVTAVEPPGCLAHAVCLQHSCCCHCCRCCCCCCCCCSCHCSKVRVHPGPAAHGGASAPPALWCSRCDVCQEPGPNKRQRVRRHTPCLTMPVANSSQHACVCMQALCRHTAHHRGTGVASKHM